MPKAKLTKSFIEGIVPSGQEVIYWDEALRGFGLRVKPGGAKSFVVQYRNRVTGASRRQTIGPFGPLMTLQAARGMAIGLLGDAIRGSDPVAEKRERAERRTMRDLARDYLETHAGPKKRPRSRAMDKSLLDRFVLPRLGARRVVDVGFEDIQRLHNAMAATPYQANRVLSLLSKMLSLAVQWRWRADNPVKGIPRFHEEKRHRWLSDEELDRLAKVLDQHPNTVAANAVRFQLLTGARIGEVLTSKWTDFDLDRGVWTKPSHHTKQKRTEHLPLSQAAVDLVASMAAARTRDHAYVFPGRLPGQPIKDLKRFWKAVTAEAGLEDYRLHDNRHTHASHLVSSGMTLAVVGRLLGHTNPTTTHRYVHLADDPLRAAAEVMAGKLDRQSANLSGTS